jgi:hypothetical protein
MLRSTRSAVSAFRSNVTASSSADIDTTSARTASASVGRFRRCASHHESYAATVGFGVPFVVRTRVQSRPSNSAANSTADSRITPSITSGQRNVLCYSCFHTSTRPLVSHTRIFSRSDRFKRNTTRTDPHPAQDATAPLLPGAWREVDAPRSARNASPIDGSSHRVRLPHVSHQVLDVSEAECEAQIQPNGVLDDGGGEPITAVTQCLHVRTLPVVRRKAAEARDIRIRDSLDQASVGR